MSPYHEVCENATSTRVALLTSAFCISLKRSSGQSPYLLWQLPIDPDSCLLKKRTDERFAATRSRDQLCEHGSGSDQGPSVKCSFQGLLRRQTQCRVFVPQRNHHVCVDSGCHCPLIPRSHFVMLFLPDGISELPVPRYFENTLWLLTGRTRIPLPSLSNSSLSPLRTPSTRRISRGTVICPLLVIVACFCIVLLHFLTLPQLPYLDQRGGQESL